jgi:hypothetical protein
VLGPFIALALPLLDAADPPPLATPPMPAGASRAELHAGVSQAFLSGLELDLAVVGAGYLVAWSDGGITPTATLGPQASLRFFTAADSDLVADRYWVGPFMGTALGTELIGRHGTTPLALGRAQFDVGLRFETSAWTAGEFTLGYGVVHDRVASSLHHGLKIQFAISAR